MASASPAAPRLAKAAELSAAFGGRVAMDPRGGRWKRPPGPVLEDGKGGRGGGWVVRWGGWVGGHVDVG